MEHLALVRCGSIISGNVRDAAENKEVSAGAKIFDEIKRAR